MRPLSDWFLRRWNSVASRRISCLPMPTVNMRWRRSWPASSALPASLVSPAPGFSSRRASTPRGWNRWWGRAGAPGWGPPPPGGWEADGEGVEMGPVGSLRHRERVIRFVARARAEGAQVLCGGEVPAGAEFTAGAYYLPTVIDG